MRYNVYFVGHNFGHGTYFVAEIRYSLDPTYTPADADKLKYVLYSRLLTGKCTVGRPDLVAPPDPFDSAVDDLNNPKEFIMFHDGRVYPEFLIVLKDE